MASEPPKLLVERDQRTLLWWVLFFPGRALMRFYYMNGGAREYGPSVESEAFQLAVTVVVIYLPALVFVAYLMGGR